MNNVYIYMYIYINYIYCLEKAKWTSATGKQGPRGRRGEGAGRAAGKWLANANHEPATPPAPAYTTARASAGADEQRAPYQRCLFHIRHACIDRQHNVDDFRNHRLECKYLRRSGAQPRREKNSRPRFAAQANFFIQCPQGVNRSSLHPQPMF
jgi:hypothetical protein